MDGIIALGGAGFAGLMQYRGWDSTRRPFANRLGAVALIAAGVFLAGATPLPSWYRTAATAIFGAAGDIVTGIFGRPLGDAIERGGPFLLALAFCALWVVALLPDRFVTAQMEWRMAWFGLLAPSMATTIPGPIGDGLASIFTFVGSVWSSAFGWAVSV